MNSDASPSPHTASATASAPGNREEELRRLNAELERQAAHLKEVNQTLIDSEQRLRLAIETGRIGLWVWNSTDVNNSGDWSQRLKEIFGMPLDAEVTHDMFLKCVHPEDRDRVNASVMQALAGAHGGEYREEYRLVHPRDGSEHWVTARGQAFFDSEGRAIRFIGTVMDITERKRAEESATRLNIEALRASEHLARGQMEALSRTLTALSRESEPEKFLEHVLRTIGERLGAHSIGVWELNPGTGRVELVATCEEERLHLASSEQRETSSQGPLTQREHPVWTEFFRSGKYCVAGELDGGECRVRILDGTDTPWYDWNADVVADPNTPSIMKQLSASGVISTLCVPMFIAAKVTGFLSIRFRERRAFVCNEIELTRALAHQAMLAIQLMRLSQESRQAAVTAERNRMARDIHDTLAQGFTGVIVQLEAAEEALSQQMAEKALGYIGRAGELARESLREARRSVSALRPQALEEKNLCDALSHLMQKMTEGTDLEVKFTVQGERREMPPGWEENLLRIGQEVLTNALRHARAREFTAQLWFSEEEIRLDLRDDGRGFDPTSRHDGFGLQGMRERVESMGGRFSIESAVGRGTAVSIQLPLAQS